MFENNKEVKFKAPARRSCLQSCFPMCFKDSQGSEYTADLSIFALTCNKLSHCLFDFDCPDYDKVYKKEIYKFDQFSLGKVKTPDTTCLEPYLAHFSEEAGKTELDTSLINDNHKIRLV